MLMLVLLPPLGCASLGVLPLTVPAKPSRGLISRVAATWRANSLATRSFLVAGVASGAVVLTVGAQTAAVGTALAAIIVPAFLGSLAGLVVMWPLAAMRQSEGRGLDAVDWARFTVSTGVILLATFTKIVPRMQPGGGYSMLGAALIAVASVVFWQRGMTGKEHANIAGSH